MKTFILSCTALLISLTLCQAQHNWQKPKPLKAKAEIERIIGPIKQSQLEKPIKILWVWGYDRWHGPGAHDYERVRDLMVGLLKEVPKVTVESVYEFPSSEQWKSADLVCMYLHLPKLNDQQFADFRGFIDRGGAVVSIHETCIMRPPSEGAKLAECIGRAWDNGTSKWGALFTDMTVDSAHPIFKNFGNSFSLPDEFYWDLQSAKQGVNIIATVPAGPDNGSSGPVNKSQLDGKSWPVAWTFERGKGRVFATSTGHNTFNYYDPEFRIVLFRAMAWALQQDSGPFMPLVYKGITNEENMVGTEDTMRNWKGKRRRK